MKEFELVCSTVIHREMDVFRALDLIALDGFEKIELVIVPGFCPHFDLESDNPSDVRRIKEHLVHRGLSVVSLCIVPGYFNTPDAEEVAGFVEGGVDLAAQFGARLVTIPSGRRVEQHEWEHSVMSVASHMRRAADYAEQRGVEISVEAPHWDTLTEDIEESAKLFERLSDDRIRCTFETSHVFRGQRTSLLEGLRRIGLQRISNIHLRDVLGDDTLITPGKGSADFRNFLGELRDCDYRGYLTLELEFEGLTEDQKRSELGFARRYVESLWLTSDLPLDLKIRTFPLFQLLERLGQGPKREIKRHPRLIGIVRKLRRYLVRLEPIRTYDGYWRNRWYIFGRDRVVVQKANSVPLVASPMRTIRVCIHGCGYAGNMHGLGYQRLAGVRVVGVCDIDAGRADALGRKLGCASYGSLTKMIEAESSDLVSVCTREWQHYEAVMQLLEAGIDVFCEKIMATTYREAQEMVDLAKARDRVLAVNYNYRFMPGIQKLKEIIQSQRLGDMHFMNIKVHAWSYHHALDLVSFLCGEICSVRASYRNDDTIRPFGGTDWSRYDPDILYVPSKNLAAIFELKSEAVIVVTSSYLYDANGFILSADAVFDDGAVTLTGLNMFDVVGRLTWTCNGRARGIDMNHRKGVFARGYEYCFYKSIESFVNAYLLHERPETPGGQGLFNMRLEKAVCRASITGREVVLDGYP